MSFDNQKQYLEGDVDSSIRGTATMWEDGSDTLRSVSTDKPLPVQVKSPTATGATPGTNDAILLAGKTDSTGVILPIRVKETTGKVVVTLDGNSSVLSQSTLVTGSKSSIGATEVQMVSSGSASIMIQIKADPNNTGIVYVGRTGLTAGTVDATDGFPLLAGDSIEIYHNTLANIYLIASASGQKVYFLYN